MIYLFLCCVSVGLIIAYLLYLFSMIRIRHILQVKDTEIMMLREVIKMQMVKENDLKNNTYKGLSA